MKIECSRMAEKILEKVRSLGKYKIAVILALAGVVLLMFSSAGEKKESAKMQSDASEPEFSISEQEARFADAIRQIAGAGSTQVVLTLKSSSERKIAENYDTSYRNAADDSENNSRSETVLVSAGSGLQNPITLSYDYPEYQGALVICQGADNASVRLAVTQAMSALTGLSTDKISVVKMK